MGNPNNKQLVFEITNSFPRFNVVRVAAIGTPQSKVSSVSWTTKFFTPMMPGGGMLH
jgi:hypothetical protein